MTATDTARRWSLFYPSRPWAANDERRWHWATRSAKVREWREAFAQLARVERMPRLERVRVVVVPHVRNRRSLADVAACAGAVKASVDGLVDAGVLPDDTPDVVVELVFRAPMVGGKEGMALVVEEL